MNDNPSRRELIQFAGIWFPLFWILVAGLIYYNTGSTVGPSILVLTGVVLGGIGLLRPEFIRPIFLGWMYAAYPIGWVVSHLLLGFIYYGIVTPIGLFMRAVGYDPMERRIDRTATSYWRPVEPSDGASGYFRQF